MGSLAAASLRPLSNGATEAVLDSQFFQSLLADALDSEQVQIALRKALETEGAEHVVESLFDSGLVDEFVDRLVADGAAWVLINAVLASDEAEQLVDSSALWALIDRALTSDGAQQLVENPALWTVINRALQSEHAEGLVAKLFDSGLADQLVDRLLTSKAVWRLVDEIAASPAVTAAVTQQSLGFADQVGGELRARARQADDWILHTVRRDSNRDGTSALGNESARSTAGDEQASPAVVPLIGPDTVVSTAPPAGADTLVPAAPLTTDDTYLPPVPATGADALRAEPRCIGIVARTLAFTVDAMLICAAAIIVGSSVALVVAVAHLPSNWKSVVVAVGAIVFALWTTVYFVAFWTTTGQTPGARIMQFRVMPTTGDKLKPRRAIVRAIGLVLAAIPLFAGYLPIAIGRKHRGLQDYLARTIVVDAPQQSVADLRRIAAHANRTRAVTLSGDATDAPDGHASHDGDQIAPAPLGQNGEPGGLHQ
ncbi:MAG: RDD family protein [Solirubrobacteraceae bacterium]